MTVYIDSALIRSKGQRWCHMLSDESFDELHELARAVGLSSRRFHRDHYDVLEAERDAAISLGAVPIDRRALVALIPELRAKGLRLGPRQRATGPRATERR